MNAAPDAPAVPMNPAPGAPPENMTGLRADGVLAVRVPENAKIFVNGRATSSVGSERQYVSRNLESGFDYTYEVRAEMTRDGKVFTQTKTVSIRAGETSELAFNVPTGQNPETTLTLHVPENAKVYLAGRLTKATGTTRVYRSSVLADGEEWNDYVVRVEYEIDGQLVAKEKTLTLRGGDRRDMAIDLDVERLADAR
jgi:uncharacterized protein (TIGR03000 family)